MLIYTSYSATKPQIVVQVSRSKMGFIELKVNIPQDNCGCREGGAVVAPGFFQGSTPAAGAPAAGQCASGESLRYILFSFNLFPKFIQRFKVFSPKIAGSIKQCMHVDTCLLMNESPPMSLTKETKQNPQTLAGLLSLAAQHQPPLSFFCHSLQSGARHEAAQLCSI